MGIETSQVPLCVDLDGTLIRSDTLHESLLLLAKTSPRSVPSLPIWLKSGKAKLKHLVAERIELHAQTLPYCENVLALIDEARQQGRSVVLVTAAPTRIATSVASNLGVFD